MSAVLNPVYISPEHYLLDENDSASGIRHEYVNGDVYAMAGASREHNRVASRLSLRLGVHLAGSRCEVFQSDMKVGIKRKDDVRFYYPDIQVSCEHEAESYYNTAPCLIIEVLSSSTARKDRIEKLLAYQGIASLQEYVLCSQDTPLIEIYRRRTAWQRERFTDGQSCLLESVGLEISVNDVYDFLLGDELPLSQ
jgi:Uma2 family endonuclease